MSNSIKPITPNEAKASFETSIPDFVIRAFNETIVKNMRRSCAKVTQNEVAGLIVAYCSNEEITQQDICDRGWFDIEPLFRKAGWKVTYDKPAYNEDYEAYFQFSTRGSSE